MQDVMKSQGAISRSMPAKGAYPVHRGEFDTQGKIFENNAEMR